MAECQPFRVLTNLGLYRKHPPHAQRVEELLNLMLKHDPGPTVLGGFGSTSPSKQKRADGPEGRNVSGALLTEFAL